jgi:imidazolonepropionase-like amidohydrolase
MPGLIDAHLSIIGNITEQNRGSLPVRFLKIAREIEETLAYGFTTVRDAGGLDWGYKEAIRQGCCMVRGSSSATGCSHRRAAMATCVHARWRSRNRRRRVSGRSGLSSMVPNMCAGAPEKCSGAASTRSR